MIFGSAGLALGLAGSFKAAIEARKAANEQRKKENIVEQQQAEEQGFLNKRYYQDISQRTDMQNMSRMLSDNLKKAETRTASQQATTGASNAQRVAAHEANRRVYGDSWADMASNASRLRDEVAKEKLGSRRGYYAQRLGLQDMLSGIHTNIANQSANASSNALTSGAMLLAYGLNNNNAPAYVPPEPADPATNAPVTPASQPVDTTGGVGGNSQIYDPNLLTA